MARIAVAVSGGADSLFALVTLQEQGHDVLALHGLFLPSTNTDNTDKLQEQYDKMHIPLHIVDLRKQFDSFVINPFIESYATGQTPNPCALCNAHIKFGLLLNTALEYNADFLATGHYATINAEEKSSPLSKGQDQSKEQSYFLSLVPKASLKKCLFPLANTKKTDNIQYLQQKGFAVSMGSESQEICFVPEDAYRPFVQNEAAKRNVKLPESGPIFIMDGQGEKQIGRHHGLWQYTEGQRRGLGIAWKEPLYVCTKDIKRNALILGPANKLALNGCIVHHINMLSPIELWPQNIFTRVRYRQKEAKATVSWHDDQLHIEFHATQSPTACGQVAAIYDQYGMVLAGGIIKEVF